MLHNPENCLCLSTAAILVLERAREHDTTTLLNPPEAAAEARANGLDERLAYTLADLRDALGRKLNAQHDAPTPERAKTICDLAEDIARLENAAAKVDIGPSPAR